MVMECKVTTRKSHYPKDGPFEVPEGWVWCKIGDIADVARGGSPRPIDSYLTDDSSGVNWIKIGDAEQGGKYINSTRQRIKIEGVSRSRFVHSGDFLLTNSMSFGRPYILNVDGCIHDGWLVISPINNALYKDFFYYLLSSDYAYQQFSEQASGAVVSNLNKDKVADALIPLPSVSEQKRIVDAVEKWLSILDLIDDGQSKLYELADDAKEKVLNLAIHGKLVPQDPSDEPAIELLKRINPDFKASDNLHYIECPSGWAVTQMKSIIELLSGRDLENSRCNADGYGVPYLVGASCIDKGRISIYRWTETPEVISKEGDVLLSCKGTVGEVVLNTLGNLHIARQFMAIRSKAPQYILPDYLEILIKASIETLKKAARGIIPGISREDILELTVMIPPFEEQQRILSRIAEFNQSVSLIVANTCN